MKRRLFQLVAGVSLLLCVVTAILLVRSFFIGDNLLWMTRRASGGVLNESSLEVQIGCGGVSLFLHNECKSPFGNYFGEDPPPNYPDEKLSVQFIRATNPPFYPGVGESDQTNQAGSGFQRTGRGFKLSLHREGLQEDETTNCELTLPLWFVLLVSALAPGAYALRSQRKNGLCRTCGYDLRATLDRCPECGTIPAAYGLAVQQSPLAG